MATRKGRATYEDLLRLPDNVVGEILGGELFASPRPGGPHTVAASQIGGRLITTFGQRPGAPGGPGGWWILDEPELHLRGDVLVPDVAGWRRERMPAVPRDGRFTIAPDWVCEVSSPSTAQIDRTRKLPIYAREAVAHLWLVDPVARVLEAYRLIGEHWSLIAAYGDDPAPVRVEPFDAVELDLVSWWPEDETPAP